MSPLPAAARAPTGSRTTRSEPTVTRRIAALIGLLGRIALPWPADRQMPLPIGVCGYVLAVNWAALLAGARRSAAGKIRSRSPLGAPKRSAFKRRSLTASRGRGSAVARCLNPGLLHA
jgi:hypothetical protein